MTGEELEPKPESCPKCGGELFREDRLNAEGPPTYLSHVCIRCFHRKKYRLPDNQEYVKVPR